MRALAPEQVKQAKLAEEANPGSRQVNNPRVQTWLPLKASGLGLSLTRTSGGSVALAVGGLGGETPVIRTAQRFRRSIPPRSAFAGFRFPPDVIVLAVRWYLRFSLSYRDVEELLSERGVEVDHVTVYQWGCCASRRCWPTPLGMPPRRQ